jgi:hypothetical protein
MSKHLQPITIDHNGNLGTSLVNNAFAKTDLSFQDCSMILLFDLNAAEGSTINFGLYDTHDRMDHVEFYGLVRR